MMTHLELLNWLDANKGTTRWQEVAAASGVTYNTISRIARGYMKAPSIVVVERLVAGIKATEKQHALKAAA
jgi:transcriptional regulator with XRE-family HTH domain